ncbi:BMA_0021/BMA_0022 family TOMM bacteriocin [Sorangium sp. So ce1504]|uniref:BMA_0021/BMA_0022 family TOMM bacteriocin n=1 Tax=Sorangium sp. So ce1504 TaxID=3133337 RepID=UPI003F6199BC
MALNKLMEFRTTYLRAIAEAWADPNGFGKELTGNNPTSALKYRFGYIWPWPRTCELQIARADEDLMWIRDEWVWPSDLLDCLTLRLPLVPKCSATRPGDGGLREDLHPDDYTRALGDYYKQRPSLFSDHWNHEYDQHGVHARTQEKGGGADLRALRADHGELQHPGRRERLREPEARHHEGEQAGQERVSIQSGPPAGGFVPDDNSFAEFNVVLLAAMAKAWIDEDFKRALKIDPVSALQTIRGYRLPWKLSLCVEDDGAARWHPPGSPLDKDHQSYWDSLQPHVLKLYLPTKPSDSASEPLALAIYNATGAEYPFTCCT